MGVETLYVSSSSDEEAAPAPAAPLPPPRHHAHPRQGRGGVLAAVEAIGADLRAALGGWGGRGGGSAAAADRVTGVDPAAGALFSAEDIAAACCRHRSSGSEAEDGSSGEEDADEEGEDGDGAPRPPPPPLKPYQVVGVNFLALLRSKGLSAILADEMGLGKSAQAAAFLAVRAASGAEDPARPFLIVVPASLLDNWARELATWAPALRVARYYGPDRAAVRAAAKARLRSGRRAADVFLTTYSAFSSDSAAARADRAFLRSTAWSIVVVDEAHAIKNAGAARSAKLASVAAPAGMRVCLTGTPLQNRPSELKSLLAFLMPDVFEGEGLGGSDDEGEEEEEAVTSAQAAAGLRRLLAPFILRRLKSEVATQLVPKAVETRTVAMVPAQAAVYMSTVAALRAEALGAASAEARGSDAAAEAGRALVRALGPARAASSFTLLRKLALHPLLARSGRFSDADLASLARAAAAAEEFGTADAARVRDHLDTLSDFDLHRLGASFRGLGPAFRLAKGAVGAGSGKAALLADLLPALHAAGHRVLLFSQWTMVLDLMEVLLDDAGLAWSRLDGSTPVPARLALVDAFNAPTSPTFCMLLSTGAGGQGLNLTGADTVIIHDVAWNPSVDRQAEDRAHRLGATRPVRVVRLVTQGTVDEGVAAIAARKLALADAVLGEEGGGGAAGAGDAEPASEIGAVLAQVLLGG
jgi:SWI/SNF-related matrix-associated actin-dependent regulator 1 of chromatin subfamily A